MEIMFTKREVNTLGLGYTMLAGTKEEIETELTSVYYVWDDAPFPYWEKQKRMQMIEKIAAVHDLTIGGS